MQTAAGNVLWDMLAYVDGPTIEWIRAKGGLAAIVISHPHFYGSMVEFGTEDTAPEPYMRPAFEIAAQPAVKAVIDQIARAWRAAARG